MTGILRPLRLVEDGVPAGLDHGRERDHVDLLLDVRADRLDLVLLLLLRVGELQVDARRLGGRLDRLRVRSAPAALRADLREPERDLSRAAPVVTLGLARCADRENRQARSPRRQRERQNDSSPPESSFGLVHRPGVGQVRAIVTAHSLKSQERVISLVLAAPWVFDLTLCLCERQHMEHEDTVVRRAFRRSPALATEDR